MIRHIFRLTSLLIISFLTAGNCFAVPARPIPQEIVQPDGSKVTLTLRGDENFHYFQTTDGYIVEEMPDGWYRIVGNDGNATALPALNVASRDGSYQAQLAGVNAEVAFDNMHAKVEKMSKRTPYARSRTYPSRMGMQKATTYTAKWDNSDGHFLRAFPAEGTQKVLIILVAFKDKAWSFTSDPHTEMQNMLEQPGYNKFNCTGSAYDYFVESSRGVFTPSFDVYGPVTLPNNMSYYGANDYSGNDQHPELMVKHACDALDSQINFKDYDRDGDGLVDNIYIFYAGYGENDGGGSNTIWPHSWDVRAAGGNYSYDGVRIGHYACSNELDRSNNMTAIGTFCHEFSHVLGLPDLYATSYTSAHTPGEYSLMDYGSYNNNGRTPPVYSGYERYALEWQAPYILNKDEDITLKPLSDGGEFCKMTIKSSRPTEYFLFENRQAIGNDKTLPGHGLLVWHIDYQASKWNNNTVNNTPSDQCVDIVEADNSASDYDMAGDPFPGTKNVTSFTGTGKPAFTNKDGTKTNYDITLIKENADKTVSFRVGKGSANVTSVTVYPSEVTLNIGESVVLAATVLPENAGNRDVTWKSDNALVASVTSQGLVKGNREGTTTIYAISSDNSEIKGSCVVTVTPGVESVVVDPHNLTVKIGEEATLSATVYPETASNKNILWTSYDSNIVSVDANGQIKGLAPGKTFVYGTSESNGNAMDFCVVTVEQPVESVIVVPETVTLKLGAKASLSVNVLPENATNKNIKWVSDMEDVVKVDSYGTITALAEGLTYVLALSEYDNSIYGYCEVNVYNPVESINVTPSDVTLNVGESALLTATVLPENATNKKFRWISDMEDIVNVDAEGKITALAPGTTYVLAVSDENDKIYGYCEVNVLQPVEGLILDQSDIVMKVGESTKLSVTIVPINSSVTNIVWTSSDNSVANVEADGTVNAIKDGETVITASTEDNKFQAICKVTVVKDVILVEEILLDIPAFEGEEDDTYQIQATVRPDNASNKELSWSSSDESIVTVDNNGFMHLVKEGHALITAIAKDDSGVKAECNVVVKKSSGIKAIVTSNESVKVYNLMGEAVFEGIYSDARLTPGYYIIVTEKGAYKVYIK